MKYYQLCRIYKLLEEEKLAACLTYLQRCDLPPDLGHTVQYLVQLHQNLLMKTDLKNQRQLFAMELDKSYYLAILKEALELQYSIQFNYLLMMEKILLHGRVVLLISTILWVSISARQLYIDWYETNDKASKELSLNANHSLVEYPPSSIMTLPPHTVVI